MQLYNITKFHRIIKHHVGKDHKDHLVQPFLAKAQSGQAGPAPRPDVPVPPFPGAIVPMADGSHWENFPPVSHGNLPGSDLYALPLVFST